VTSLRPPAERARRHLDRIAELFLAGAVRPPEIKVYPLAEAAAAHAVSQSRHLRGKLVLQVR
jgi:NADPH:quinone reductase-like Zn-dependent oxidoreductase